MESLTRAASSDHGQLTFSSRMDIIAERNMNSAPSTSGLLSSCRTWLVRRARTLAFNGHMSNQALFSLRPSTATRPRIATREKIAETLSRRATCSSELVPSGAHSEHHQNQGSPCSCSIIFFSKYRARAPTSSTLRRRGPFGTTAAVLSHVLTRRAATVPATHPACSKLRGRAHLSGLARHNLGRRRLGMHDGPQLP